MLMAKYRVLSCAAGVAAAILVAGSAAAQPPPPGATWYPDTAIATPSITVPANGAAVRVNRSLTCTCTAGSDLDKRVAGGQTTYPADTLTYTWSASRGTFPSGNTDTTVTYQAPSTKSSSQNADWIRVTV